MPTYLISTYDRARLSPSLAVVHVSESDGFLTPPPLWREWLDVAQRTYRSRARFISTVAWFAMVCVSAVVCVAVFFPSKTKSVDPIPKASRESKVPTDRVTIQVAGAVVNPGVYQLISTQRVVDAIKTAGGGTRNADPNQLNLAAKLVDGQRIYVPKKGESVGAGLSEGNEGESAQSTGPISLSTATEAELDTLNGVGPATAAAIIKYREEHGPFSSVDDLLDVPGIGEAKLANLRDQVVP